MSETQQEAYVKTHPGRVWRRKTELLVTVPVPEKHEEKQVTRERLAEGVRQCFQGPRIELADLEERCFVRPLMLVEVDLLGREYGVVLQP